MHFIERRARFRAVARLGLCLWTGWAALVGTVLAEGEWPQFRGLHGNGHADASELPLTWSESQYVVWKTPIHDRGWSSPVIWDNQVWVTTASEDGRKLYVVCVDRSSGRILRDQLLFEVVEPQFCHKFNSYASPTPVVEKGRIYVTFGSPGTACLDTATGEVLWQRRDFVCNHFRGAGSSPVLFENLLILHFDGSDHQYVVALDKQTGETVWRTDRSVDHMDLGPDGKPEAEGDFRKAFSTPHLAEIGGKPTVLSIGAKAAYAYEPRTGTEIWRVTERGQHSASTRPIYGDGLVIYPTGFSRGQLLAVRPDGHGEVTDTHVAWRVKRSVPNKPSILHKDGLIFMIEDGGIASCLESATGEFVWNERIGGNYSASPLLAGDRIYAFSEEGKGTVIRVGRTFEVLAENNLEDGFMSSPAVAGQALFLRTRTHLYRIEKK